MKSSNVAGKTPLPASAVVKASQYRKAALVHYKNICVVCGFGISEILEIAHLLTKTEGTIR